MRRLSVLQIVLISGLPLLLFGQQATQAAEVSFVVKQATYSGTGGVFRCEAKLSAGDTATVKLTVPKEEADSVFASLHTSYPAKLSRAAPSKEKVVITVSMASSTALTAGITYRTQFDVAKSYSIRYGIQQSANEKEQAELNGYLHVHDKSKSNAQWSGAKLLIKRPALDDLCRFNVNMEAGQTYISPIADLVKYAVQLAKPEPNYFRTSGEVAYEVRQLTNSGVQTLAAGNIRVMSSAGSFLYGTVLRADLPIEKTVDLLTVAVDEVSVKVKPPADRWYEAISLDYGVLKYRPWSITETIIKNESKDRINVYVEDSKEWTIVEENNSKPVYDSDGVKGTESSTDLFDLSKEKLVLHVAKLKEFVVVPSSSSVNLTNLECVRVIQEEILTLITEIESLASSIDTTVARIAELTSAGADTNVIAFYTERKGKMTKKRGDNENAMKKEVVKLAVKLKEMDTARDSKKLQ